MIDVDGTLVLVAGSPFTKNKVEKARAIINQALTRVWNSEVPFEVIVEADKKALVVIAESDEKVYRSFRNIENVETTDRKSVV